MATYHLKVKDDTKSTDKRISAKTFAPNLSPILAGDFLCMQIFLRGSKTAKRRARYPF